MKKRGTSAMERYRRRRRERGLRPIQIWVPDTRSARFVREFRRQARRVSAHDAKRARIESKAMDALMAEQDTTGWIA